jgi:DNA polymerase
VDNAHLAEHLRFFQALGVTGVSLDARWRRRAAAAPQPSTRAAEDAVVADASPASEDDATPAQAYDQGEAAPVTFARSPEEALEASRRSNKEALEASRRSDKEALKASRRSDEEALKASRRSDEEALEASRRSDEEALEASRRSPEEALQAIRSDIGDCTRCKLHRLGRRQIVFGVGNPSADLMFVGEAPGADEDVQGIPFVGRAGQLLTKIIEAIGLRRDDVYIANVIKCRPPENRNPEPDEVATCEPFLFEQIDRIKPKVIVALGTFAAKALLKTQDPISRLRGRAFDYRGATLIPTFHPAFLLRSPERKRDVWEDMKKVRALLQESAGDED